MSCSQSSGLEDTIRIDGASTPTSHTRWFVTGRNRRAWLAYFADVESWNRRRHQTGYVTELDTIITSDVTVAAMKIREGELVAFPTETVYGLGANAFDESAVRKIFAAKERPSDNPLIVHIGEEADISRVAQEISDVARALVKDFFPGPLTLLLRRSPRLPEIVTAGSDLVGIRMPRNEVAIELIQEAGMPIAAPSANRSGRPSPTTWEAAHTDLRGRVACVLASRPCQIGIESTVVDVSGDEPVIVRPGAVTLEMIVESAGSGRMASRGEAEGKSPGTRHRHYAPRATVRLADSPDELVAVGPRAAWIGTDECPSQAFDLVRVVPDLESYAHNLFHFFRLCDERAITEIWCQTVPRTELGIAIMDRLLRASEASGDLG